MNQKKPKSVVAILTANYYVSVLLFLFGMGLPLILANPDRPGENPVMTHEGLVLGTMVTLSLLAMYSGLILSRNFKDLSLALKIRGGFPTAMLFFLAYYFIVASRR